MCPWDVWLHDNANFKDTLVAVTTSWVNCLQADPLRFVMTLPNSNTLGLDWYFGDAAPTMGVIHQQTNVGYYTFHFNQLGSIIQLPVWVLANVLGPNNILIKTASWQPERKRVYDAVAERSASQFRP